MATVGSSCLLLCLVVSSVFHMADQGAVWEQLADRASELEVDSPTGAMRDLYARQEPDMAAARQALAAQLGQVGALTIWPVGGWGSTS